MTTTLKRTEQLSVSDLIESRVWEYVSPDETDIRPVESLPVCLLGGRLVGTRVHLGNGMERWAVLANVSLDNPRKTKQFMAIWVENDGKWFELARYFDVDYERRGPRNLASFLGRSLNEVFPISYDISDVAIGHPDVITGRLLSEPDERLSEDELIELSMELGNG